MGRVRDRPRAYPLTRSPGHRKRTLPLVAQGRRGRSAVRRRKPESPMKDGTKADIEDIWSEYLARNDWRARLVRIAPGGIVTALIVCLVAETQPDPLLSNLHIVVNLARWLAVAAVVTTMFDCTDAFNLGQVMIRELARRNVAGWEKASRISGHKDLNKYVSNRWRTMDLVVRCTEIVGPIVVFPLLPVGLLMLARSTIFEGW